MQLKFYDEIKSVSILNVLQFIVNKNNYKAFNTYLQTLIKVFTEFVCCFKNLIRSDYFVLKCKYSIYYSQRGTYSLMWTNCITQLFSILEIDLVINRTIYMSKKDTEIPTNTLMKAQNLEDFTEVIGIKYTKIHSWKAVYFYFL